MNGKYYILLRLIVTNYIFKIANGQQYHLVAVIQEEQTEVSQWLESIMSDLNQWNTSIIRIKQNNYEADYFAVQSELPQNANIIVDLTWSRNEAVDAVATSLDIPYIHIEASIYSTLHFLHSYLAQRGSSDVVLIFEDVMKSLEAIHFWMDSTLLRIITTQVDGESFKELGHLRPIPSNFIILASTNAILSYVEYINQENLSRFPQRLLIIPLDFTNHSTLLNLFNTSLVLLSTDEELCCKMLKLDENCACPKDFNLPEMCLRISIDVITSITSQLDSHTKNTNAESTYKMQNEFMKHLKKSLNKHSPLLVTGTSIKVKGKGKVYITDTPNSTSEIVANYHYSSGITPIKEEYLKPNKPYYRIGVTHAIPWSFKKHLPGGNWYWTGYCIDFAQKLAEHMQFDYEIVEPSNGTFGKKQNGKWNGLVGDLASGEIDMAISALYMTADREEVIDFVAPYFEQVGITIVMRKPVKKTSLFKFMTVLKLEVWLSIIAALIVTGLLVWFLDKYSPYSSRNNKQSYPYSCREFTLKESFWFALTSFTPQGGGEAPKALSGRILVASYWLFVVLMLATFTANLAAFLTVERMQTPVQSLEQLAKQSRINYTVVNNSDTHRYFINMKFAEDTLYTMWKEVTLNASVDDTRYRVWDYPIKEQYGHILLAINDSNPVISAEEGFRIVNDRTEADFAFIHDSAEITYEISRNCNFTQVGDIFAERPYAIGVQQGSHLQDNISRAILILQHSRAFEQLTQKYWNSSAKGDCFSTDDNAGISLDSLGGVFIATLFGLAIAIITLIFEIYYYKRQRKYQSGQNKKLQTSAKKANNKNKEKNQQSVKTITIGDKFQPVNYKNNDSLSLSHINLYPRARHQVSPTKY